MQQLAAMVKLPNVEFGMFLGDEPAFEKVYYPPVPMMHWVRSMGHWEIPFPSFLHERALSLKYAPVPWDQKIEKAYFRGGLSHPSHAQPADIPMLPRIRLLRLAKERPDLFDAAIFQIDPADSEHMQTELVRYLRRVLGIGEAASREDFSVALPRHKYLINVDGVVASFRMAELLGAGSVVLSQVSYTEEFFMGRLQPWVHYVPIDGHLSDLVEKIELLRANDTMAREIAESGLAFWKKELTMRGMWCYMWRTLRSIADASAHNITLGIAKRRALARGEPSFYGNMYKGLRKSDIERRFNVATGQSRSPLCCPDAMVQRLQHQQENEEGLSHSYMEGLEEEPEHSKDEI